MVDDEDIQAGITFEVPETVAEAGDFRSIAEDALPPNAAALAGPIESGAKSLIDEVAGVVAPDLLTELWEDVNRIGHVTVVKVLEGDGNEVLDTSGGRPRCSPTRSECGRSCARN